MTDAAIPPGKVEAVARAIDPAAFATAWVNDPALQPDTGPAREAAERAIRAADAWEAAERQRRVEQEWRPGAPIKGWED